MFHFNVDFWKLLLQNNNKALNILGGNLYFSILKFNVNVLHVTVFIKMLVFIKAFYQYQSLGTAQYENNDDSLNDSDS